MEDISNLFYNDYSGMLSLKQLWEKVKQRKILVQYKTVKQWYNEQSVNEVFKKHNNNFTKIVCPLGIGCVQMDLMDMTKFPANKNGGFKYLCVAIDVKSRYCWVHKVKTKSPDNIKNFLQNIREVIKKVRNDDAFTLTTDDGTEFKGLVSDYLKKEKIKRFIANPKDNTKSRTYLVERMNRTILDKLKKSLETKNNNIWVDVTEAIVKLYNNTIHSSIGQSPSDVLLKGVSPKVQMPDSDPFKVPSDIQIGDSVRVLNTKTLFDKKSLTPNWSREVYKIHQIKGSRFEVKNKALNVLRKTYLKDQLLKTDSNTIGKQREQEITQKKRADKVKRRNVKSGLDTDKEGNIVVPKRLQTVSTKRIRKKPIRYS